MVHLKRITYLVLCGLVLGQEELVSSIGRSETQTRPEATSRPEDSSEVGTANQTDDQSYSQSISTRDLDVPNAYSPLPQPSASLPPQPPLQSPVSISPFPTTPDLLPYSDLQPGNSHRSQPDPTPVSPPPPQPVLQVTSASDLAAWAGIDSDDFDDGDVYAIIQTTFPDQAESDEFDADDLTFTRSFLQLPLSPNPS